ncbi:MAG: ATP-dependent helicase [Candidatus Nitrosocaldaceae archaeon]|nr:MAG: ATP-dependent helicase [Candidatus Nitrosocaldaceae archaeon]
MNLLSKFYGMPRKHQVEVIKKIEDALKNGYNDIILSAPTGTGKSYIAICLALAYGSSSILTATTDLQEQYLRDFPFIKTIKGRRNFQCLRISNKSITCDKISSSLCYNKNDGFCEYYPYPDSFSVESNGINEKIIYNGNRDELCEYYKQKFEALLASHTVYNYHEYLALLKYTNQVPHREVMVCDEAHLLENRLVEFYGLNVSNKLLIPVGMKFPAKQLYDIDTWLSFLNELRYKYMVLISEMEKKLEVANGHEFINLNDELSKIQTNFEKIEFIHNEIENNPENYVVNIERDNDAIVKATLLPIDVDKFTEDLFSMSNIRLFMSATIDHKSFSRSLGLKEVFFIDIDSPFPIENRRIKFLNKYLLNKNAMRDERILRKVAESIDEIMNKHKDDRGLILVTSYALALAIRSRLSLSNKSRIIISNDVRRDELVKYLANDKNNVIISPSLWDGIDLKDDLCRFIIIAKAPYLDLNDRRIAVKMRKDIDWYTMQSAMRLIQGCGRGVRHDLDYCNIYVLDKNAMQLLRRVEDRIPEWFKKACIF